MRSSAASRKKRPLWGDYFVEIVEWSWSSHISAHRFDPLRSNQILHIEVSGPLVLPTSANCRNAYFVLSGRPDEGWDAGHDQARKWTDIGLLSRRDGVLSGHLDIPYTTATQALTMLAAGALRRMVVHGPALYRGKALATSLTFDTRLRAEDYPDDYYA
jgi:hypothetical protein